MQWLETEHTYLVTADGLDDAYAQAKAARVALIEAYTAGSPSDFAPYLGAMKIGTFGIETLVDGRPHPNAGFVEIFTWKVDYQGSMDQYFESARERFILL
jgi:hypothetical protein